MKRIKIIIAIFLVLNMVCCTTAGEFTVFSSNPASEIYINGELSGRGMADWKTSDAETQIEIITEDHQELSHIISPIYMNHIDPTYIKYRPQTFIPSLGIAIVSSIAGILGFSLYGAIMTEQDIINDYGDILLTMGTGGAAIAVLSYLDTFIPKPYWEKQYLYDISSLSYYDESGYHKENGFNKFGVTSKGEFRDGSVFTGRIVDGNKTGFGRWKTSDGNIYDGNFYNDMLEGFAIVRQTDGSVFYGYWDHSNKNGIGVLETENNDRYLQIWRQGELQSSEFYKALITGSRYNWIFLSTSNVNGLADGYGNAVTMDGKITIESGKFTNGRLTEGRMIFPNGKWLEGQFDGDLLVEGRLGWADGRIYEGALKDGIPNGKGEMNFKDGTLYTGYFLGGNYDGEGKIIKPDGESFEGSFKNGKPHGSGIFFKNGQFERCEYYDGERIDQAYLIRIENQKQIEVIRAERILMAKEQQDREEQDRLERERLQARQQQAAESDDSFFGALLVGGATALIGSSMGLDTGDVAALSVAAAVDAYSGDESMSTMKSTAEVLSEIHRNEGKLSSNSTNSNMNDDVQDYEPSEYIRESDNSNTYNYSTIENSSSSNNSSMDFNNPAYNNSSSNQVTVVQKNEESTSNSMEENNKLKKDNLWGTLYSVVNLSDFAIDEPQEEIRQMMLSVNVSNSKISSHHIGVKLITEYSPGLWSNTGTYFSFSSLISDYKYHIKLNIQRSSLNNCEYKYGEEETHYIQNFYRESSSIKIIPIDENEMYSFTLFFDVEIIYR